MKKKIIVGLVVALLLVGTVGAFAEAPFAAHHKPKDLNLYGSVGLYGYSGLSLGVGAEWVIGKFDLGPLPFEWGVMARGVLQLPLFIGGGWVDWGVAPLASLHTGFNFGKSLEFDVYVSLGLGIYGTTGTYYAWSGAAGFGFASFNGDFLEALPEAVPPARLRLHRLGIELRDRRPVQAVGSDSVLDRAPGNRGVFFQDLRDRAGLEGGDVAEALHDGPDSRE